MFATAKSFVREHLSTEQLAGARALRSRLSVEAASAAIVSRLGMRRAVGVKERIQVSGRLDYAPANIHLALDSSTELVRLGACSKEPDTVRWLERNLRPDDVLYDIGANVGAYSFVAHAITRGRCHVVAFEPSFSTFAALCKNIVLNRCGDQISPLQIALSRTTGLQQFYYSNLNAGASMHGGLGGRWEGVTPSAFRQPILTYRLDQLVAEFELPRPNHLKIDVDGPELDVLEGAGALLDDPALRSILVEVDENLYRLGEIPGAIEHRGFRLVERYGRIAPGAFNYIYER